MWHIYFKVGHVFRDDHPYDFGSKGANNVFVKNNNRFVHTWMDEYRGKKTEKLKIEGRRDNEVFKTFTMEQDLKQGQSALVICLSVSISGTH